ncbi:MAG: hypothetical protein ACYDCN_00075 [Bacteroidia bacterium]
MATTTLIKTIIVVLPATMRTNINTFDVEMQHVHDMLNGNTDYPTLQGDLPQFQTDITLLETDETHVLSHLTGAVGALNAQKKVVYNTAEGFRGIVQTVVNKPANIANAVEMVAGAAMLIKGKSAKTKADLTARPGKLSGTEELIKKSVGRKAAYLWYQSKTDIIMMVPCNPPCSLETKVTILDLIPKTDYYFECVPVLPVKKKKKGGGTTTGVGNSTGTTAKVAQGVGQATQRIKVTVV